MRRTGLSLVKRSSAKKATTGSISTSMPLSAHMAKTLRAYGEMGEPMTVAVVMLWPSIANQFAVLRALVALEAGFGGFDVAAVGRPLLLAALGSFVPIVFASCGAVGAARFRADALVVAQDDRPPHLARRGED